jgi:hypothetical protein
VIEKADHFLMMSPAEEFNRAMERAIHMLTEKSRPGKMENDPGGMIAPLLAQHAPLITSHGNSISFIHPLKKRN